MPVRTTRKHSVSIVSIVSPDGSIPPRKVVSIVSTVLPKTIGAPKETSSSVRTNENVYLDFDFGSYS